ncbi:transketolase family protein [Desulfarculus baarsii]|nr:transketolase [Desulfarculus baarsii]
MALEGVREALGDFFINCGVAEQNMVSVAAGLARGGFSVYVYSIAPFCYARPFEQIRNDLGGLPVCLVGNGGGFGYGVMGPSHHALEDCSAMSCLGLRVLVPAFDDDIPAMLESVNSPTYLRLGRDERPSGSQAPGYAPWRPLLEGRAGVLVALGPLAGLAWGCLARFEPAARPSLWAVTEFPLEPLPEPLCEAIAKGQPLGVLEEHVAHGGLGMQLTHCLASRGVWPRRFVHRHALRYPSGTYGSQGFHRAECGLDAAGLEDMIARMSA